MTERRYRSGAIGALMDEYERAAREFQVLIRRTPEDLYGRIADAETEDESCRSIQTVTTHVIAAGFGYANYLREQFALPADAVSREPLGHAAADRRMDEMLAYTIATLDGRWELSDDEITGTLFRVRWGPTYDVEQLLEHAIVHVLRHRRQVERFLLKFETVDQTR